MGLALIIAPTGEPLTSNEAKLDGKIEYTEDDALILSMIITARQLAEHKTGRQLMTATYDLTLDCFPPWNGHTITLGRRGQIVLPLPPLQSVSSIVYVDPNGATQTLATSEYVVDGADTNDDKCPPGRIFPAYDKVWPDIRRQPNAVKIRFVAGYANVAKVPEAIRRWMLMRIGAMDKNREAAAMGQINELPRDFLDGLLDPFRIYSL
jgi:uncharacterized phiE125 gp8 family phage protein